MMNGKVSWLGVVVAPWCKVIVSLAGSAVNLDLDTSDRLGKQDKLCQVENKRYVMSSWQVRMS